MKRVIRDGIGSALMVLALGAVLTSFDPRVRERLEGFAGDVAAANWPVPSDVVATDNVYLAGFLIAGVVLVGLMLKT